MPLSAETRFFTHVNKTDSCWLWTASLTNDGYGRFAVTHDRIQVAHRWLWERVNGPVPEGLQLDHLCKVKRCVRPSHLEAVTGSVNMFRTGSPYCPKNHLKDKVNANGYLVCSECHREAVRRHRAKAVA